MCIGSGVAEAATLPICLVKTVYQNENSQFQSARQAALHIYKTEGVLGFYKASFPAIAGQVLTSALKYSLYEQLRHYNSSNTYLANVCNSVAGSVVTSLITHPVDVVKIDKQLNQYEGLKQFVHLGPRAWYRGYSKGISKNLVGACLYLPLNDFFKSLYGQYPWMINNVEPAKQRVAAAFSTAVIAGTCMHPFDLWKTRHIGKKIWRGHGIRATIYATPMWRGLGINLMRLVPHFTISMSITDFCTQHVFPA